MVENAFSDKSAYNLLDNVLSVGLFSSQLRTAVDDTGSVKQNQTEKKSLETIKVPECSGRIESAQVLDRRTARYLLTAIISDSPIKVTITATYFVLFSSIITRYSETDFSQLCKGIGKQIIWPKFRDLSAITFAQSGWQTAHLPVKACEFEVGIFSVDRNTRVRRRSPRKNDPNG